MGENFFLYGYVESLSLYYVLVRVRTFKVDSKGKVLRCRVNVRLSGNRLLACKAMRALLVKWMP